MDLVADGALDFLGGQDASHIPDRVPDNAYFAGVNVSVKKGSLQPRWGFEKRRLEFPDELVEDQYRRLRSWDDIFYSGKFQMAAPYSVAGVPYVLVVISGFIFLINITTLDVQVLNQLGPKINSRIRRLNWTVAGNYFVIFEFPAPPIIIDGFVVRRSDYSKYEVPAATIGTFNQSRLFIGNALNGYTAGDPVGVGFPNAPITFEEIEAPAASYLGQVFGLPTQDQSEVITAMGFLQVADTSTGIGPLLIASDRAIYSAGSNNPRSAWQSGQFGSILVYNSGIVGPRAIVNVNSDVLFMSSDGHIRALSMSRDEQKSWAHVPISREVANWLKFWDKSLMSLGFVTYFENKIFFSANPYRMAVQDYQTRGAISDYAHGGLVVLELDNFVSFGQSSKPTWAGLWTGVNPMDMVKVGTHCFVLAKEGRANAFYEVNPEINHDTADDKIRYVRSVVYTKEYDFKDPFANKEAHSVDINLDELRGDFSLNLQYKPNHAAKFLPWKSFKYNAPWRACCIPGDEFINGFAHHMVRDITLGTPDSENECNPITNEFYRVFRKAQLRFEISGKYWEMHEYKVKAVPAPKEENDTSCVVYPTKCIGLECDDDWKVEAFDACNQKQT